jgi:hypothetical protein
VSRVEKQTFKQNKKMKNFSSKDLINPASRFPTLFVDSLKDLVSSQLPWQKAGLQQTTSGYGAKLTNSYKVSYEEKLYRIYTTCYSNSGSSWFTVKGQKIYIS